LSLEGDVKTADQAGVLGLFAAALCCCFSKPRVRQQNYQSLSQHGTAAAFGW